MEFAAIRLEVSEGIARITLNRPDAANAIDVPMARDLFQAAIRCSEDPAIRAVLLTATGRFFSAGGNLKVFAGEADNVGPLLREITGYLHGAISTFARMDAPVVSAVNGAVAGGAIGLAVCADIVIAARSATFTLAYTSAGLTPDGGSTFFLPRLIGLRRTQELALTPRRLTADEALAWGLVTRVVDDADLQADAERTARAFAQGPTGAYGGTKRLLADTFAATLETQMGAEARGIAAAAQSRDGREGIAAFTGKRKPAFVGRSEGS